MAPVFLPRAVLIAWPLSSMYFSPSVCLLGKHMEASGPWRAVCLLDSPSAGEEAHTPRGSRERLYVWFCERSEVGVRVRNLAFLEKCSLGSAIPPPGFAGYSVGDHLHGLAPEGQHITPPSMTPLEPPLDSESLTSSFTFY